ncbi:MAG: hypothetical protein E6K06_06785 [Methanobacteriota archaeon]|nr:MAG: hypothetical protein E6K06_06785 [Euryarchaeota archaeon]
MTSFVDGFNLPTNTPGEEKKTVPSGATTKSLRGNETGHRLIVAVDPAALTGTLKPITRTITKMPIATEIRDEALTELFDKGVPPPDRDTE